jgi:hypothetical protein
VHGREVYSHHDIIRFLGIVTTAPSHPHVEIILFLRLQVLFDVGILFRFSLGRPIPPAFPDKKPRITRPHARRFHLTKSNLSTIQPPRPRRRFSRIR